MTLKRFVQSMELENYLKKRRSYRGAVVKRS